ncbi:hypothetical protein FSY75_17540 [Streptomyces sp. TR1341]|nr:hypothetical protein [Streptomyces sp. TR1341]
MLLTFTLLVDVRKKVQRVADIPIPRPPAHPTRPGGGRRGRPRSTARPGRTPARPGRTPPPRLAGPVTDHRQARAAAGRTASPGRPAHAARQASAVRSAPGDTPDGNRPPARGRSVRTG